MTEIASIGREELLERIGTDPRWMLGERDDGVVVVRERDKQDGPWLELAIREGVDTYVEPIDVVHGVLALHVVARPGCTCGGCPASLWNCSCGQASATEADGREHVAARVVEALR